MFFRFIYTYIIIENVRQYCIGVYLVEKFVVTGGKPLFGNVNISGAKNAAVAIIPAVILCDEPCQIENIPNISDVTLISKILQQMGATVRRINKSSLYIDPTQIKTCSAVTDLVRGMRASYYLLGALLGKCGKAKVALPGGCNFGVRPIDQHLKGFEALGAETRLVDGAIIEAECTKGLVGTHIYLDVVSVGATMNIMLAASRASGQTIIENAAREPHIVDLANFLNSMGADIRGAGTDVIKIRGVSYLHGVSYSIIPDQIEAGTYMCAAVATRGCVTINNITPKHLESITAKFREMGVNITEYDEAIKVDATSGNLKRCNIKTMPHPGFPTDCQPQFTAMLMSVPGTSIVNENVWDNRYQYISELVRMGAHISVEGRLAIIEGGTPLTAAPVKATDLRAGAAMIIAALEINGTTEISSIQYIERGYEDVVEKFRGIGADIKKVYFTGDNEQELGA
ncbi:UDP-N-acetylglucosamine 1-carboxyvinyltransferase [Ruminococcus sp. YE282]|nr:UDP-N-acetylglucosamine 1-carboxyvinyltransferase [Ruminococcus bromii]